MQTLRETALTSTRRGELLAASRTPATDSALVIESLLNEQESRLLEFRATYGAYQDVLNASLARLDTLESQQNLLIQEFATFSQDIANASVTLQDRIQVLEQTRTAALGSRAMRQAILGGPARAGSYYPEDAPRIQRSVDIVNLELDLIATEKDIEKFFRTVSDTISPTVDTIGEEVLEPSLDILEQGADKTCNGVAKFIRNKAVKAGCSMGSLNEKINRLQEGFYQVLDVAKKVLIGLALTGVSILLLTMLVTPAWVTYKPTAKCGSVPIFFLMIASYAIFFGVFVSLAATTNHS